MLENENINETQNPAFLVGAVSGWVAVTDALPKALQTVWLTNGKGWCCLGCLIEELNCGTSAPLLAIYCWQKLKYLSNG